MVLHYDHGLTFARCMEALKLGFTSVMFDGSAGDAAENIAATREMVRIAHAMGATVEGEIGHVGRPTPGTTPPPTGTPLPPKRCPLRTLPGWTLWPWPSERPTAPTK